MYLLNAPFTQTSLARTPMLAHVGFSKRKDKHCATLQVQPSVVACVRELVWAADPCRRFCVSHHEEGRQKLNRLLKQRGCRAGIQCRCWLAQTSHVNDVGEASKAVLDSSKRVLWKRMLQMSAKTEACVEVVLTSSGIASMLEGAGGVGSVVFYFLNSPRARWMHLGLLEQLAMPQPPPLSLELVSPTPIE